MKLSKHTKYAKYIFLILMLLSTNSLSAKWSFNFDEVKKYSDKQLEVLKISFLVGEQKGLGLTLATIAIVETRAGKYDFTDNHICGPHQVDVNYYAVECETLESNPYASAMASLEAVTYWQKFGNTWKKTLMHYNGGWDTSKHGKEYYRRAKLTITELLNNKEEFMKLIGL